MENDMERSPRHYQSRREDHNGIKSFPYGPYIQRNRKDSSVEFHDGQDDRTSRSNTPCPSMTHSMTHCSSTSASSLTTTYGADVGQCSCQSLVDSEGNHYPQSDTESPRIHPTFIGPQRKEKELFSSQDVLKQPGYPVTVPRSVASGFSPTNTISFDELGNEVDEQGVRNSDRNPAPSTPFTNIGIPLGSKENQIAVHHKSTIDGSGESDVGENDEDEDEDEDEDDEDDWSGQDDNLEATLLDVLGYDLPLAAYLIPLLYKEFHSEFSTNINKKVGPWRYGVTKCAPDAGAVSDGKTASSNAAASTSNPDARKRSRGRGQGSNDQEAVDEDEDEEEDDDDKREPKRLKDNSENEGPAKNARLACPFYKLDPSKYRIQHEVADNGKKSEYRVCAGPGFKNITRLKEHLKRKHYPVQCERCYHKFDGPDRAARARELENHRQLPNPCQRKDPSLKEGISDAQWASLDRKKKNLNSTNIEKWNEIWKILFPKIPPPDTPWYDQGLSEMPPPTLSEGSTQFLSLFSNILVHHISQQNIRLEEGMQTRVLNAARAAFEAWTRLYRLDSSLSSTNSSSLLSHQHSSYLDGSYQLVQMPRGTGRHRLSTITQSTVPQSQVYSMDMSGSPTGSSVVNLRHNQRDGTVHDMVPRYMAPQPFPMGTGASTEHRAHAGFPVETINNFVSHFTNNQLETGVDPYYSAMDYDGASTGFIEGSTAANINGAAPFPNSTDGINPSQTLINSARNPLHQNLANMHHNGWHHPFPEQQRYSGPQP